MEKYLIYYDETSTSRRYVENIYRNSIGTDIDVGDAIEFDNRELALKMAEYLNKRDRNKFKVICIKTTIEEVVE